LSDLNIRASSIPRPACFNPRKRSSSAASWRTWRCRSDTPAEGSAGHRPFRRGWRSTFGLHRKPVARNGCSGSTNTDLWDRRGFFRMFRHWLQRERVRQRLLAFPDGERRLPSASPGRGAAPG
jgi:hypothetical protein